jgi:hypothetical protein
MANIFDFFIERDKKRRPKAGDVPAIEPGRLGLPPTRRETRDIDALINQPLPPDPRPLLGLPPATPAAPIDRSLVPPFSAGMGQGTPQQAPFGSGRVDSDAFLARQPQYDQPTAAAAPILSPRERMNAERVAKQDEIAHLQDYGEGGKNPIVNKDHGFMGRLGDVLKQALIAGSDAYKDAPGAGWEKLAGGLGGMGAGAFQGGFDPAVDERRARMYDIAKAQGQLSTLDDRYKQSIGEERALTDIDADRNKNILNAPVKVKSPLTGEELTVTGSEALTSDGRQVHDQIVKSTAAAQLQQRNEESIREAAQKAQEQRDKRKFEAGQITYTAIERAKIENAKAQNDAEEKNVANSLKWHEGERERVLAQMTKISEGQAAVLNANGAMDRLRVAEASLVELRGALEQAPAEGEEVDEKAVQQTRTKYAAALKVFADAQKDVYQEAGKAGIAAGVVQALKPTKMPARLKAKLISASEFKDPTAPTRTIQSSQLDAFAQSKGWTRKQAEDYAKNNNWTVQ